MPRNRALKAAIFLTAVLSCSLPASAIRIEKTDLTKVMGGGPQRPVEVAAEQVWIKFSSSAFNQRAARLSSYGARVVGELPGIGWTLVQLPGGMRVADGLGALRSLPGVEKISPNYVYRPNRSPNDPLVSSQYDLSQINAFAGWEYEVGNSTRVTVAFIDTGIEATQPDLADKLAGLAHRFCHPTLGTCSADTPLAACNHGTRTSGIAAASTGNGQAIAGVSWGAQVLSIRVFQTSDCTSSCADNGSACATDDAGVAAAIDYARSLQNSPQYGKIVINISLGQSGAACSTVVGDAISLAAIAGIPVIISAGNDGGAVNAPANCAGTTGGTGIIPVGATDSNNNVASFSSRGAELAANGVVAPGVNVLTLDLGGNTATASGTSFSAPHVTGLAALILAAKPNSTAAQVQSILRGGAENIGVASLGGAGLGLDAGGQPLANSAGAGRVNAFRSLRLAVNGTLADFVGDQKAIAFPNPFRAAETGTVSFTIPLSLQGAQAKIRIYTAAGQLVRELTGLAWDGKNTDGKMVASGTYIFLVSTDKGNTRGRVAVIR